MYSVYFGDKAIHFIGDSDSCGGADAAVEMRCSNPDCSTKVIEKLGNSKRLWVKSDDPAAIFAGFCQGFRQVQAAGGLVRNSRGDSLMILRDGRWDLPKGCVEEGEDIVVCAVREVGEECGLRNIEVESYIGETYHIYDRDGVRTIKETVWYRMSSDDAGLTPQTEEGIEKAEWVPACEVNERLAQSYPAITEVFNASAKAGRR